MPPGTRWPARADGSASDFFSERLGEHVLVEREVRHHALQPRVLVLELAQPAQLADAQVRVLLLPGVERGLTHAELPADVPGRRARLGLAQGVGDLLFGELRALHGPTLLRGADRQSYRVNS